MSLPPFPNYLFVPSTSTMGEGVIYELDECPEYVAGSVVLIPYSNPQVKRPETRFLKIVSIKKVSDLNTTNTSPLPLVLNAGTSRSKYIEKVNQLKEHIQLGNIYEINFCVQFFADAVPLDPLSVFLKLHSLSKAPYAMLLKLGEEYIISSSPELFLQKKGNHLSTKPIKGTIRRGSDKQEDEFLRDRLFNSVKERTENVMAVDVARNDLSIIASKGSVQVNKLYNIESYETVHQMVSTVHCELKENLLFREILDATFPMASMTGAPKKRAMQLIDEFENQPRGNYSGAMGIIGENEDFELSVIIRSIFYNERTQRLAIHVGSAITYLSDPEEEYNECLLKARALLEALNAKVQDS